MRKESARRLMMARLFGEITPDEDAKLNRFLSEHADAAREWEQVQSTHSMLASMKDQPVPPHLESSVSYLARSREGEDKSGRKAWAKPLSIVSTAVTAAACLLLYIYVPTEKVLQQKTNLSMEKKEDHSLPQSGMERETYAFNYKETQKNRSNMASSPNSIASEPSDTKLATTSLCSTADQPTIDDPEELFRTGLTLYNTAFTKVGEERTAMLKSAVVFLRDLEERAKNQSQWMSLSLILLADSYRALGDIPASIKTYQRMIEMFPDMETYVKQARFSIVKLLVEHTDNISQMESALEQFTSLYPENPDVAEAVFAFAEKMEPKHPEQSLKWYRRLAEQFQDEQILHERIQKKSVEVQEKLDESICIKDWWILGPMDLHYLPVGDEDLNEDYFYNTDKVFEGYNNLKVQWKRPYENEKGIVNIPPVIKPLPDRCSAFALTYIYSEKDQEVILSMGATCGFRVRVNNEPIFANINNPQQFHKDQFFIQANLRKGWNPVLVKLYRKEKREWKFAMSLRDTDGYLLTDIVAHPDKKPASESNHPTPTAKAGEDILRVKYHENRD